MQMNPHGYSGINGAHMHAKLPVATVNVAVSTSWTDAIGSVTHRGTNALLLQKTERVTPRIDRTAAKPCYSRQLQIPAPPPISVTTPLH